jgi:hypothetical protein
MYPIFSGDICPVSLQHRPSNGTRTLVDYLYIDFSLLSSIHYNTLNNRFSKTKFVQYI